MKINFDNLFLIGDEHGLKKEDFDSSKALLEERLAGIKSRSQGFYEILDDEKNIRDIEAYVKRKNKEFDTIVVLGIGGSALGLKCIQQALFHAYKNEEGVKSGPRLYVLDNIDPVMVEEVESVLDLSKTLFVVVSKSGTTSEPMTLYLYFRNKLDEKGLGADKHFVFITDKEKGILNKIAEKDGVDKFSIPANVGGRFSVLTSVGLLPGCLSRADIGQMIKGALEMRERFLSLEFEENLPYQLALAQYLLYRKGKLINVLMPYSSKLDKFGDWFCQLIAESTGKAKNNYGEIINVGITPTKAIGTTDQHSQTQLYNEGPNNKLIILIEVEEQGKGTLIPGPKDGIEELSIYGNLKFKELMDTARRANVDSFTKNKRPNVSISVDRVDEYGLGQLFFLFEAATAFLGELFEINVFNQPGVELSKVLTKEGLKKLK